MTTGLVPAASASLLATDAPNGPGDETLVILSAQLKEYGRWDLEQANSVADIVDLRAKTEAVKSYILRAIRDRTHRLEAQNNLAELRLRQERRIGQLLPTMDRQSRGRPGKMYSGDTFSAVPTLPTLPDLGISRVDSSHFQQIATVDEQVFENYIKSTVADKGELTTAAILRIAKGQQVRDLRDSFARMGKSGTDGAGGGGRVVRQDASVFLQSIEPASVDLLLTDPPYMTDCPGDVHTFAHLWLPMALSRIKPTGRAYVCIGAYPDELLAYLSAPRAGMELADVLVWTYRNTLGPAPTHHYKLNWQAVLHFQGAAAPPLDCPLMNEQFSVQDISAPDGRRGERWHAWQKPDELAERLIRHSTQPGALIIDPFAGTGTFLAAAARLGRFAAGSEPDPAMLDLCAARGLEVCDAK